MSTSKLQRHLPDTIYIQVDRGWTPSSDYSQLEGSTHSTEKINDDDVAYRRVVNKCESCAFMTILYPNLENTDSGALCTQYLWSGDAPPDGAEFADCPDFRNRAPYQYARDCEKSVPWGATDESKEDEPVTDSSNFR